MCRYGSPETRHLKSFFDMINKVQELMMKVDWKLAKETLKITNFYTNFSKKDDKDNDRKEELKFNETKAKRAREGITSQSNNPLIYHIESDNFQVNETSEDVFGKLVVEYLKSKSTMKFQDMLIEMVKYLHVNLEDFDDK